MRILIDIGHPAHVHLFHYLAVELEKKKHTILFTCREKEFTIRLLSSVGFQVKSFGKPFNSGIGKLWGLAVFNFKMLITLMKFKPGITLGHGSLYAAQMSWLLRIPHISLEDTGNMEQIRLYRPFTKAILVPDSFHKELGKKQIRYPGNHELAYLHPKRFTPDASVLQLLNLKPGEPYVMLRFIAWKATHDAGHSGISTQNKLKAVKAFSAHAKVFISSEIPLPDEFTPYLLQFPPEKIHHLIAFSSLLYGESATMASEAAVLGVPAIYLDNTGRCYTREEEEKYGLVFNYSESEEDQLRSIDKGVELLKTKGIKEEWKQKRMNFLNDKIDVTGFLCRFIEEWPSGLRKLKNNSNHNDFFSEFKSL